MCHILILSRTSPSCGFLDFRCVRTERDLGGCCKHWPLQYHRAAGRWRVSSNQGMLARSSRLLLTCCLGRKQRRNNHVPLMPAYVYQLFLQLLIRYSGIWVCVLLCSSCWRWWGRAEVLPSFNWTDESWIHTNTICIISGLSCGRWTISVKSDWSTVMYQWWSWQSSLQFITVNAVHSYSQ